MNRTKRMVIRKRLTAIVIVIDDRFRWKCQVFRWETLLSAVLFLARKRNVTEKHWSPIFSLSGCQKYVYAFMCLYMYIYVWMYTYRYISIRLPTDVCIYNAYIYACVYVYMPLHPIYPRVRSYSKDQSTMISVQKETRKTNRPWPVSVPKEPLFVSKHVLHPIPNKLYRLTQAR